MPEFSTKGLAKQLHDKQPGVEDEEKKSSGDER